jgi:tRNA 2-selenouridine synthase
MAIPGTAVGQSAMSVPLRDHKVGVDRINDYPDRIDVRSPSEFADDHIPGAVSCPVLDDAERAGIGLLHARESAFAAKRVGAALVARNIAAMLESTFADKPRTWAPLVYCWRGGKRSEALVHILNEIGWRAGQLDGGYRAYRRHVVTELTRLPPLFRFEVICGLTGSGKSRLLAALRTAGAQTLDLEALAKHRGSSLGDLPNDPQPSQKGFETGLCATLARFDPARPVYVESESRKIGTLQVPDALLDAMRRAECIRVDTPQALRVELLKDEYAHFLADSAALSSRLEHLVVSHGRKRIERWKAAAAARDWDRLVGELLACHYDPMYARSMAKNYPNAAHAIIVSPGAINDHAFADMVRQIEIAVNARQSASTTVAA